MNMCLIQLISTERHYLSVCNLFLNFFFLVSIIVTFFFLQNRAAPELKGYLSVLIVCNAQINAADK